VWYPGTPSGKRLISVSGGFIRPGRSASCRGEVDTLGAVTSKPAAILLDGMGTLVALTPPAPALRSELAARLGVEVTLEQAAHALAAEISYYRAHLQDGHNPAAVADLRARCAEVLRAALPPDPRLATASGAELTAALLASLRFEAYPDAVPALLAARRLGRRLVVVSNWDASLPEILTTLGLAPLLDGIVTSAQVGFRKPAPEIFERALELAGCGAQDALHVGDSLEEDVVGAQAAGIPVVLLARDGAGAPAGVRTIASLTELAGLP